MEAEEDRGGVRVYRVHTAEKRYREAHARERIRRVAVMGQYGRLEKEIWEGLGEKSMDV